MGTRLLAAVVAASLVVVAAACNDDGDEAAQIDTLDSEREAGDAPGGDTEQPDSDDTESGSTEAPAPPLLLIIDASGSMQSRDESGQTLLESAQQALVDVVEGLPDGQHVGLRAYGHSYPSTADPEEACIDTELIHPVEPLDRGAMIDSINSFDASGYTPIARSLAEGAEDLPAEGQRTMVLVSDGMETCADQYGEDPCSVAEGLQDQGIEVVIHTVGFALDMAGAAEADQARDELSCIAEAADGQFVEAEEAGDLADAIDDAARGERVTELGGIELEGAPVTRDANTGQLGTRYVDTVARDETNFYRFEVAPGSEVQGEVHFGDDADRCAYQAYFAIVGRDGDGGFASGGDMSLSSGPTSLYGDPVVVDEDEVWLKVVTRSCSDGAEFFQIELQLSR